MSTTTLSLVERALREAVCNCRVPFTSLFNACEVSMDCARCQHLAAIESARNFVETNYPQTFWPNERQQSKEWRHDGDGGMSMHTVERQQGERLASSSGCVMCGCHVANAHYAGCTALQLGFNIPVSAPPSATRSAAVTEDMIVAACEAAEMAYDECEDDSHGGCMYAATKAALESFASTHAPAGQGGEDAQGEGKRLA